MIERVQILSSVMERKRRRVIFPLAAIITLLIISAIAYILVASFRPPEHDANAAIGTPVPDESYMYGSVTTEFGYGLSMAANLYQQEDGSVNIYFTNPIDNEAYLRCQILDSDSGKELYNTGYIKPGEYIESLPKGKALSEAHDVIVRIYAYTPETFTSEGTCELTLKLQPW